MRQLFRDVSRAATIRLLRETGSRPQIIPSSLGEVNPAGSYRITSLELKGTGTADPVTVVPAYRPGRIEKEEREATAATAVERSEGGRVEGGVAAEENSRRSTRITYVIVRR